MGGAPSADTTVATLGSIVGIHVLGRRSSKNETPRIRPAKKTKSVAEELDCKGLGAGNGGSAGDAIGCEALLNPIKMALLGYTLWS